MRTHLNVPRHSSWSCPLGFTELKDKAWGWQLVDAVAIDVDEAVAASVAGSVVLSVSLSSSGLFWPLGRQEWEERSLLQHDDTDTSYIYVTCESKSVTKAVMTAVEQSRGHQWSHVHRLSDDWQVGFPFSSPAWKHSKDDPEKGTGGVRKEILPTNVTWSRLLATVFVSSVWSLSCPNYTQTLMLLFLCGKNKNWSLKITISRSDRQPIFCWF